MEDKNLKWIRDIRDKNYEMTKNMSEEEKRNYYNEKYEKARAAFESDKEESQLAIK